MHAVRALAHHGSFREAAEATGTSPASFSRHIVQAETYAGHQLFNRGRTGAQPTPAGREFLRLLEVLHDAGSVFEASVDRLRTSGTEMLNIGCGPLTTRTLIAPVLADQLHDMPNLRVRVSVRANKEPLEALRRGALDVAVCDLTHTPDLSDLDIQVIQKRIVSFWARPEHPIHQRGRVDLADVFRQPFVTAYLHRHWRNAFARVLGDDQEAWKIVERLPQIESDDFGFLADLACRRDLIFGGIEDAVSEHVAQGLLKEVPTSGHLTWNICAARRKAVGFPALDAFWVRLVDQFGGPGEQARA